MMDETQPHLITEVNMDFQSLNMPAIVDWETGQLKPEMAESVTCNYRENKLNPLSGRDIFIKADNKLYQSYENTLHGNLFNFIAVRNKRTRKVRLFLAESLKARLSVDFDKTIIDLSNCNSLNNRFQSNSDFQRAFGSKRAQRAVDAAERMRANMNQLSESISEAITERDIAVEDVNLHSVADMFKDILPPCNRNAEKIEDVYNLDDLINESELEDFKELANDVLTATDEKLAENCTRFLIDILSTMPKPLSEQQISILLYAEVLVQLAELKSLSNKNLKSICPTARILKKIKDTYTLNSLKSLSRLMQDKVVCHIFILLLLACNFKIFYSFLTNCCPFFKNKQALLRIIGTSPFLKNNDNVFILRLPLPSLPLGNVRHSRS